MLRYFRPPPSNRQDLFYSGYASINMPHILDANSLVARLTSRDERRMRLVTGSGITRSIYDSDYDSVFLNYGNIAVVQHACCSDCEADCEAECCSVSIYIAMNTRFDWYTHLSELTLAGNGFELSFEINGTAYGQGFQFLFTPPRRQLLLKSEATRLRSLLLLIMAFSQMPGTVGAELLGAELLKIIFSYLPHW